MGAWASNASVFLYGRPLVVALGASFVTFFHYRLLCFFRVLLLVERNGYLYSFLPCGTVFMIFLFMIPLH